MLIHVSHSFSKYEVGLTCRCRKLHRPLHNWSGPFVPPAVRSNFSRKGTYYRLDYDIILLFDLTELKAMVAWNEDVGPLLVLFHISLFIKCCQGVERRSPARIIYDPDPVNDRY